jgi:hypothetical protein
MRLTILRERPSPPADPHALALGALGWVLAEDSRAQRLLSLTGLAPDDLRAGPVDFLCAHEADLIAAAEAIGVSPGELAAAREGLGR